MKHQLDFDVIKPLKSLWIKLKIKGKKKSKVHVILARFFLFINLILMAKTLCYDAQKLKKTELARKNLLRRKIESISSSSMKNLRFF